MRRVTWKWLFALIPLGLGLGVGSEAAYQTSLGGLGPPITGAFLMIGLVAAVAFLLLMAGLTRLVRAQGGASLAFVLAAVMLGGGGLGGGILTPLAGWHDTTPPPFTERAGTISVTLTGVTAKMTPNASVNCVVGTTGELLSMTSVATIGTLQDQPVVVDVDLGSAPPVGGQVTLSVRLDLTTPPAGDKFVPGWTGGATVTKASANRLSGSLSFGSLGTMVDPSVGPAPTGWPATLRGTIEWSCRST